LRALRTGLMLLIIPIGRKPRVGNFPGAVGTNDDMTRVRLFGLYLAPFLAASPAVGQGVECTDGPCFVGQHRDIAIAYEVDPTQPESRKLVTGAFDWDAPLNEENLFFGEPIDSAFRTVTSIAGNEIFSDTPGFVAVDSGGFGLFRPEDGTEVAFDAKRIPTLDTNLAHWNGNGSVAFGPVPSCEALGIQGPSCTFPGCADVLVIEGDDRDEPGFPIASVSGDSLHSHLDYFLLGPPSQPTDGCPPPSTPPQSGVYLWSMAVKSEGFEDSDPMFVVMGTPGIPSGPIESAQQWVAATLVPEPATTQLTAALLGALATLAGLRRRAAERPARRSRASTGSRT